MNNSKIIKNITPENYINLFKMTGKITLTHSYFFLKGSHGKSDPILIYKNGVWNTFANKKSEKICQKEGLKLFSSKAKYKKFSNDFKNYILVMNRTLIKKYRKEPASLNVKELNNIFSKLSLLWRYYGYTEFIFHDLAYDTMKKTKNIILDKNLRDLEKLKFEGRKLLNSFVFEHGIIPVLLRYITKKYIPEKRDASFLLPDEILDIMKGGKIKEELISKRSRCYVIGNFNGKTVLFSPDQSIKIASLFESSHTKKSIEGIVASKGIVRGNVVIAPMLTDSRKVKQIIRKMKKGDVLVAESTTPELMPLCKKASAIVTDQGGMLSHAAIVSRELNIPCVIGTQNATQVLKDGDLVEVDANNGVVKIIKRAAK